MYRQWILKEDLKTKQMINLTNQTKHYEDMYEKYGHSADALSMPSDRRNIRYYELIKNFEFFVLGDTSTEFSIVDLGCGFGDVNAYLRQVGYQKYRYLGVDVVESFLSEGKKAYGRDSVTFVKRNFIEDPFDDIASRNPDRTLI